MIDALLLFLQAAPATAAGPLPSDPVPADWRPIPDDELMVMTLADGRVVTIRLAGPQAPQHVANVRALARAHWWDGLTVYRVQENWVVQWGDQSERKPLADGVVKVPAAEYDLAAGFHPAQRLARADAYSAASGITADGWAVAGDGAGAGWLTHCYASVGVARDAAPDTGSGTELFAPLGGSARRLDRNYTIVGRVIDGMGTLAALPRSAAPMGMYATAAERIPIATVRLASDLPAASRPHWQYRSADNPRFAAMIALREHPGGMVALGGVDVCDVPLAVRRAE
ncbi:peptidylprolyl isomerase [Sphingomonas bacterium]|uniref:peptidylprolyl isomerase n=1 Tax=Sphingomonas bacterium TaxID=1895847 RepID=UPI001575A022|nr:peptidylprolyl isomerase [Sphingomonas bacterium]